MLGADPRPPVVAGLQMIFLTFEVAVYLAIEDKNAPLEGVNCGFGRAARRQ